jgi:hypothetical protein
MLSTRLSEVTVQKKVVPAVRFENHVEHVADKGGGAHPRNAKFQGTVHYKQRDQGIMTSSMPGINPMI